MAKQSRPGYGFPQRQPRASGWLWILLVFAPMLVGAAMAAAVTCFLAE